MSNADCIGLRPDDRWRADTSEQSGTGRTF
jgi:hypothetical protein